MTDVIESSNNKSDINIYPLSRQELLGVYQVLITLCKRSKQKTIATLKGEFGYWCYRRRAEASSAGPLDDQATHAASLQRSRLVTARQLVREGRRPSSVRVLADPRWEARLLQFLEGLRVSEG